MKTDDERCLVRDQFIAKLQRKKRHLSERQAQDFETRAGMSPEAFIAHLRQLPLAQIAQWFTQRPDLGEILDRSEGAGAPPIYVSTHADTLLGTGRGYGNAQKPEDYLDAFGAFLDQNMNLVPALKVVTQRPRELTREALKSLWAELDKAGFTEANLQVAWRSKTLRW